MLLRSAAADKDYGHHDWFNLALY